MAYPMLDFTNPGWTHAVYTLLHTLWQAPIAAALLFLALRATPSDHVNRRYLWGLLALGAVVLAAMVTRSLYGLEPMQTVASVPTTIAVAPPTPIPSSVEMAASPSLPAPVATVVSESTARWTAWVALAWLVGAVGFLLRTLVLAWRATALGRKARPVADVAVRATLERTRKALRVARRVRIVAAEAITTPAVLGVIWPVIIVPPALLTGLSPATLEAILAHELAHIRRHDYLVNLVQLLVEALLFFNPAVWWISRQIRAEREACCDAIAARTVGDPVPNVTVTPYCREVDHLPRNWRGVGSPQCVTDSSGRFSTEGNYGVSDTYFINDMGEPYVSYSLVAANDQPDGSVEVRVRPQASGRLAH